MKSIVKKIIFIVFPFLESFFANKKIKSKDKNESNNLSYMADSPKIDLTALENQYKESLEIKNKLEDKAKTNIAALTISISLILGLSNLINNIYSKNFDTSINICFYVITLISIIYMIIAGVMSIAVLVKENVVYKLRTEELCDTDEKKREHYCLYTKSNVSQNLVRNNLIFSAYKCIANSFILLIVIFSFSISPSFGKFSSSFTSSATVNNKDVLFGVNAIKYIESSGNLNSILSSLQKAIHDKNNGYTDFCIVDKNCNAIIFVVVDANHIYITDIKKNIYISS